ncbi:hypothetical protein WJX73_007616 [Symbiochloris irregularis]|uniref:Albumin domain-containing protein n=1 Tax=Symbiochloris irregularis TaxID=706552 RepID=A0AAW1NN07_9CHLO
MAEHCCASQEPAQSLSEVFDSAANDPALQSCCARDLREQAYAARLKAELLSHDRSNTRRDIRNRTFDPYLNSLRDAEPTQSDTDSDLEADGEELNRLRSQRLVDLQLQARRHAERQCSSRPQVTECSLTELPVYLRSEVAIVCHVFQPGDQAANEIDELLDSLCPQAEDTVFLRAPLQPGALLPGLNVSIQAGLYCFVDNCLTGCSPTATWVDLDFDQRKLLKWLQHTHVLPADRTRAGPMQRSVSISASSSENGDGGWQEACQICGRHYPHEHIRNTHAGGSAADSDHEC